MSNPTGTTTSTVRWLRCVVTMVSSCDIVGILTTFSPTFQPITLSLNPPFRVLQTRPQPNGISKIFKPSSSGTTLCAAKGLPTLLRPTDPNVLRERLVSLEIKTALQWVHFPRRVVPVEELGARKRGLADWQSVQSRRMTQSSKL